jgi:hypothetical protein
LSLPLVKLKESLLAYFAKMLLKLQEFQGGKGGQLSRQPETKFVVTTVQIFDTALLHLEGS